MQGSYWGDHNWEIGDEEDSDARTAYESLLRVSLLQPTSDKFQDFAEQVKERAQSHYNYNISHKEEVSIGYIINPELGEELYFSLNKF